MGSPKAGADMITRLVALLFPGVVICQSPNGPIKVGEVFQNLLFPKTDFIPEEVIGGVQRVLDGFHNLDDRHLSCGKRQLCDAMSIGSAIERSDGSIGFEKGFLRQAVDGAGEAVFDMVRPLLEAFGLGRVARREVSFTTFLVDMLDSAIIGITRVLAGRRLSRQLEAVSPVATFLEPAANLFSLIPKSYYGSVLDLFVDVTGLANRDTGLYGITRSGGLGYFYGGGDDSICTTMGCDEPINMLNTVNDHKLGQTVRFVGEERNPLMDRTHNEMAVQTAEFKWQDLMSPSKMLCKMNNYMNALQGHIDVVVGDYDEPEYVGADYLMLLDDYEDDFKNVTVRMNGAIIRLDDKLEAHDREFIRHMEKYEDNKKKKEHEGEVDIAALRPLTSEDKFDDYCKCETLKEIEEVLEKKYNKKITVKTHYDYCPEEESGSGNDNDEEVSGTDEDESQTISPIVDVRDQKSEDALDKSLKNLELLARLGDHSLLSEKMDVEDGTEFEAVESLVNTFNVDANGKIERVVKIDSKKGVPTLLIQFDSTEYRDAVLKSSRTPEARSSTRARLRRPKVKDLKHVVSLLTNH